MPLPLLPGQKVPCFSQNPSPSLPIFPAASFSFRVKYDMIFLGFKIKIL